jgi:hypothetical protein
MTAPANDSRLPLMSSTVTRKIGANNALRFATRRQDGGCGVPRDGLGFETVDEPCFGEDRAPDDRFDPLSAFRSLALRIVSFPSSSISTSS